MELLLWLIVIAGFVYATLRDARVGWIALAAWVLFEKLLVGRV